ncbi:NUDIX hydrolase [Clostridium felsineum]|uniref:Methanol dehydrogenase activator n=1 Tax=Clostridium felsineum TaxID=36839 RepID=A0A1S8L4U3_9CLOT|nr:NUDIX hydrolase [Clostridium felsineum]MCR3761255.1 NUDIX hydrolase [Clostridium felsineum]URZ00663.1 Methanol dehydrogenase activator [Clostridium felsineum]URZ06697.1 Methanol dehydrogenase activator [Clostridium felsineum]URZ11730.1 Methanol dehydrogenase activator [Clostridium felsineum]URZ16290.1 Methanol dehydrogenase activator [Clostridium felsineum DSM 794]
MKGDKLAYDGWLKVYRRDINGKAYDILKNYDAVSAFITNEFNDVLMVKQFRPAVMSETLEIPAGCLDIEGESPEDCLIRELREETNLQIEKKDLQKIISYKPILGFSKSILHLYHIEIKKSDLISNKVNDEDVTEVMWIDKSTFVEYIKNGKISDGKTIISYLYLQCIGKDS